MIRKWAEPHRYNHQTLMILIDSLVLTVVDVCRLWLTVGVSLVIVQRSHLSSCCLTGWRGHSLIAGADDEPVCDYDPCRVV